MSMKVDQSKDTNPWHSPRWEGIQRPYTIDEVEKLRCSVPIRYSLAEHGSKRLWNHLTQSKDHMIALGAVTGAQAVNMVRAGLKTIYVSGWQVAADANLASNTYPDQSLYPSNSVPNLIKRIQNALMRADQVEHLEKNGSSDPRRDWFVPILADAEAGFGGPVHAFELMKQMIEAGAAGVSRALRRSADPGAGRRSRVLRLRRHRRDARVSPCHRHAAHRAELPCACRRPSRAVADVPPGAGYLLCDGGGRGECPRRHQGDHRHAAAAGAVVARQPPGAAHQSAHAHCLRRSR